MSSALTVKQEKELRDAFDKIDRDGNHKLDEEEIKSFLVSVGMEAEYAPLIMKIFDTDDDKAISFEEFKEYINALKDFENEPKKLFQMLFQAIAGKDNAINADEMVELCGYLHIPTTREEAVESIKEMDKDGNETITFDEFCEALGIQ